MAKEYTLSIIKPNVVAKNLIGKIISIFEEERLLPVAIKMVYLTRKRAEEFYYDHKGKFFFNELIDFMISGPIVVQVLEGEDAVKRNREIIGDVNPLRALPGTIRARYADSFTKNAVHGSDSVKSAYREICFFFHRDELSGKYI